MSDPLLQGFGALVRERLGLDLERDPALLARRLDGVTQTAGLHQLAPGQLLERLEKARPGEPLWQAFCDAVPNHETSLFRDVNQLELAVSSLIATPGKGAVRLLCVGCSTGEELYSLAMLCLDRLHGFWGRPIELHGVDVSVGSVKRAKEGVYSESALARAGQGPAQWRSRFMRPATGGHQVRDLVKNLTRFHEANLRSPDALALLGPFDVVLCRNVLIYFEAAAAQQAVASLRGLLKPGGILALGAPEAPLLHAFLTSDEVQGQVLRRRIDPSSQTRRSA